MNFSDANGPVLFKNEFQLKRMDEWKSFVMSVPAVKRDGRIYSNKIEIRPSTASYEDYFNTKVVTMDSVILTMSSSLSVYEALMHAALYGITVDFIDVYEEDGWDRRTVKTYDCHKDDIDDLAGRLELPPAYVARDDRFSLKYAVVDTSLFDWNVKTRPNLGEFQEQAVVARFKFAEDAAEYAAQLGQTEKI